MHEVSAFQHGKQPVANGFEDRAHWPVTVMSLLGTNRHVYSPGPFEGHSLLTTGNQLAYFWIGLKYLYNFLLTFVNFESTLPF